MTWFQDVYNFFHAFFEFLSFRTNPRYEAIEQNCEEYEFIILNEKMER